MSESISIERLGIPPPAITGAIRWTGYVLFFGMLFLPTVYQGPKGFLLAVVTAGIAFGSLWRGRIGLHPMVLSATLLFCVVGLIFMFLGALRGAPGALRVGTVYVAWPLVYAILVAGSADGRVLTGLMRVLVVAGIAIGLYGLSYVLYAAGILPEGLYLRLDQGQSIGFYEGFVEVNLYSLASLLFLIPFLLAALVFWQGISSPVPRGWLWAAFLFSALLAVLSGRRALLAVLGLSPLVIFFVWCVTPSRLRPKPRSVLPALGGIILLGGFVGIYLGIAFDLRWQAIVEMVGRGFDFTSLDPSSSARAEQFRVLLDQWTRAPLFGAGHGASAASLVRSDEMPWAYELSYVALLYQTGLAGLIAYSAGIAWIFMMGLRLLHSGQQHALLLAPVLVGTALFLVGNATNPYLVKYDYLWVIFLPVAIINHWLLIRSRSV
ncbi:hypothetical protein BH18GEM1_BH18GEM1_01450 [soil metagenome]